MTNLKLKRKLITIFTILCVAFYCVSSLTLSACSEEKVTEWSEWMQTKAATCKDFGEETRYDKLDNTIKETRQIPKLHHVVSGFAVENIIEVSCEDNGGYDEVIYCDTCGIELFRNERTYSALGHEYGEWITDGNIQKRVCKRDSNHIETITPTFTFVDIQDEYFLYSDLVKSYLVVSDANVDEFLNNDYNQAQAIEIKWENQWKNASSLTFEYSRDSNFSSKISAELNVTDESILLYNLFKSSTYFCRLILNVDGEEVICESSFRTSDLGPRTLHIDNIYNTRDLGGYLTESGKTTKQGILYRGGNLVSNDAVNLTDEGKNYMSKVMCIKTDLDLRGSDENIKMSESPIPGANWLCVDIESYKNAFNESALKYRQVFSCLANPTNYPVYMHCDTGADKTGTVSFLINALCGVNIIDLIHDYEITSFSYYAQGSDTRNSKGGTYDFSGFYNQLIQDYEGNTLSKKVENYMLSIGVTEDEIFNIKAIMFGEETRPIIEPTWELTRGAVYNAATDTYTLTGQGAIITTRNIYSNFTLEYEIVENTTTYTGDGDAWGPVVLMGNVEKSANGTKLDNPHRLQFALASSLWGLPWSALYLHDGKQYGESENYLNREENSYAWPDGKNQAVEHNTAGAIIKMTVSNGTIKFESKETVNHDWLFGYEYTNEYIIGTAGQVAIQIPVLGNAGGVYSIKNLKITEIETVVEDPVGDILVDGGEIF